MNLKQKLQGKKDNNLWYINNIPFKFKFVNGVRCHRLYSIIHKLVLLRIQNLLCIIWTFTLQRKCIHFIVLISIWVTNIILLGILFIFSFKNDYLKVSVRWCLSFPWWCGFFLIFKSTIKRSYYGRHVISTNSGSINTIPKRNYVYNIFLKLYIWKIIYINYKYIEVKYCITFILHMY